MKIGDKLCNFIWLYSFPNQTKDELGKFSDNHERNFDRFFQKNAFLVAVSGDFNGKPSNWHYHNKSSLKGNVDTITNTKYGIHQVIKEPTHTLDDFSTCNDLIFTLQPNIIIESGVHPSLHPYCRNLIAYAKFNLKIHFPPLYSRRGFAI